MGVFRSLASMKRCYARKESDTPLTRSELVGWLWHHAHENINVFKEGPLYALRVEREVCVTGIRCLRDASFGWWRKKVLDHLQRQGIEPIPAA